MAKKKWSELTDGQKGALVAATAVDAGLRLWAGRDLSARSGDQVNGPKWLWTAALATVSSMGVLPAAYLLIGRKKDRPAG